MQNMPRCFGEIRGTPGPWKLRWNWISAATAKVGSEIPFWVSLEVTSWILGRFNFQVLSKCSSVQSRFLWRTVPSPSSFHTARLQELDSECGRSLRLWHNGVHGKVVATCVKWRWNKLQLPDPKKKYGWLNARKFRKEMPQSAHLGTWGVEKFDLSPKSALGTASAFGQLGPAHNFQD